MIRSSSSVGFPEPRERGPKVRDWPLSRETISPNEETGFSLNDETRFPLPGDWRTDFSPATWCRYATSSPGVVGPQRRERALKTRERPHNLAAGVLDRATDGPSSCERRIAQPIAWRDGELPLGDQPTSAPRARSDRCRPDIRRCCNTMTGRKPKRGLISRSGDAEAWITSPATSSAPLPKDAAFSARFTIDVTPEWRGSVRLAAFQGGVAVADVPRAMLEGAFPQHGAAS